MRVPQADPQALTGQRQTHSLIPYNEPARLKAVHRYQILDTAQDYAFDRITALAARVLQVPVALISIVDSDRIWFKSRHGFELSEVAREPGLCASAILQYAPWVVTDAASDTRTLGNSLTTGKSGIRFYAGAALSTIEGYNLGTLCVMDRLPRSIGEAEVSILKDLACMAMHELELRFAARQTWDAEEAVLERLLREKEHAEHDATHDALTGLGNRRQFEESFSTELNRIRRHGGRLCVAMADIDHFKRINDRYGHATGDEVLARFGELLRKQVRPTDVVARLGGEEFAILMPHTSISDAVATAERIRRLLAKRSVASPARTVTASFGVAELEDAEGRESLLLRVDQAMYQAKRCGRNKVVVALPYRIPSHSSAG